MGPSADGRPGAEFDPVGRWVSAKRVLVGGLEPWNFMTFHAVGKFIIPTDELIFFRGVGIPPTSVVFGSFMYVTLAWMNDDDERNGKPVLPRTWSTNGGFLKWGYHLIIYFNRIFHYKSSILGYPHCRKPPNIKWRAFHVHLLDLESEFQDERRPGTSLFGG